MEANFSNGVRAAGAAGATKNSDRVWHVFAGDNAGDLAAAVQENQP